MIFLAVKREERYSPNRSISDKAMMDAACSALKEQDDMIFKMQEYELGSEGVDDPGTFDAVLHMCRSEKALVQLDAIEKSGVTVVNRPDAVRNCRRSNEVRLLSGTDANFVVSRVVSGGEFPDDWNSFPCWLKRGDTHAIDSDDVCFAATRDEASAIMKNISAKGSGEVVLQEHVPGKIVKFYGVGDGRMFHYRFLETVADGKFGLEIHNEIGQTGINEELFRTEVVRIAGILGVDAYGGDAIVTPEGKIVIVDFNDWPSFFDCRAEAAKSIAELIREKCAK